MYTNTDFTEVLLIYGKPEGMQERLGRCINNVYQTRVYQLTLCL
jgi:hypothetical protein